MTKNQLDNLVEFCFLFHQSMGNGTMLSHNPTYIFEKWDKYIGVNPIKDDTLDIRIFEHKLKPEFLSGRNNKDVHIITNMVGWSKRWGINNYDKLKEILYFIQQINCKIFWMVVSDRNVMWGPIEIVDLFKDLIGDPNKINNERYHHLHTLIQNYVDKWKEIPSVKKEYEILIK